MAEHYDVIVVGGGPGGYTAALYCVRAGLSTLVLERMTPGGQMATTNWIENYPGFEPGIDGYELSEKMNTGAERFGAKTIFGEVERLDLAAAPKRIQTTSGEFLSDNVILAMGANPRPLGLAAEERLRGRGVSYCATCDGMFYRGKTVVVAGGGNSAAEDALTLSKLCQKVYIVHRRDTLRATQSYLKPLAQAENIEILYNRQIVDILGDNQVSGVTLRDTQSGDTADLACDGVFVAIGRLPNTALVEGQIDLDETGYIRAGEDTCTNLPGVFAVGDLRTKPLRQVITAAADGAVASKFAEEHSAALER